MIREPEKGWFVAQDVAKKVGVKKTENIVRQIKNRQWPLDVKLISVVNSYGRFFSMSCITQRAMDYLINRRRIRKKSWEPEIVREPEIGWFVAKDFANKMGRRTCSVVQSVRVRFPSELKRINVTDSWGRKQLMNCITQKASEFVKHKRDITPKDGYVYGFVAHRNGQKGVKFGRTVDWNVRKYNYRAYNKPKHVFLLKKVNDQREAEKKLLKFARESPHFTLILDFGREWFETDLSDSALDRLFSFLV